MEKGEEYTLRLDQKNMAEMESIIKALLGNVSIKYLEYFYAFAAAVFLMITSETYNIVLDEKDFKNVTKYSLKLNITEEIMKVSLIFPKEK